MFLTELRRVVLRDEHIFFLYLHTPLCTYMCHYSPFVVSVPYYFFKHNLPFLPHEERQLRAKTRTQTVFLKFKSMRCTGDSLAH